MEAAELIALRTLADAKNKELGQWMIYVEVLRLAVKHKDRLPAAFINELEALAPDAKTPSSSPRH